MLSLYNNYSFCCAIMKKISWFVLLLLFAYGAHAQTPLPDKYSTNNYSGDWTSASAWSYTDGSNNISHSNTIPPSPTSIPVGTGSIHFYVNGYVTRYGDLTFADNYDAYNFSVNDTLVVTGNVVFGNKSMNLRIPAGGLLIVFGNFSTGNKIVVENGGMLIVKGNVTFTGADKHGVYTSPGSGQLYAGGTVSGDPTAEGEDKPLSDLPSALYDFIMQDPAGGPISMLPVDLLYFNATTAAQGIQLEWASAKEWDFSHYTVERSQDGINFAPIHTVNVAANSNTEKRYAYADRQPQYGANYYRLKATDIDGTEEIKGMALAYAGTNGDLKIAPNPAKGDYVVIRYPGAAAGTWLSIQSATGKEKMRIQMPAPELRLPTSVLPAGMYIITVSNQFESRQAKLIIQ